MGLFHRLSRTSAEKELQLQNELQMEREIKLERKLELEKKRKIVEEQQEFKRRTERRFFEFNIYSGGKKTLVIDRETGVNYLYFHGGYGGGLTVLVDENGKPLVTRDIPDWDG